jgi:hypothetical protein
MSFISSISSAISAFAANGPLLSTGPLLATTTQLSAPGNTGSGVSSGVPVSRDSAITDLSSISSAVNLLAQASGTQTTGGADAQLTLPPLPQMPAAASPPSVPTDDHGTSNVVFSDPEAAGDLIH